MAAQHSQAPQNASKFSDDETRFLIKLYGMRQEFKLLEPFYQHVRETSTQLSSKMQYLKQNFLRQQKIVLNGGISTWKYYDDMTSIQGFNPDENIENEDLNRFLIIDKSGASSPAKTKLQQPLIIKQERRASSTVSRELPPSKCFGIPPMDLTSQKRKPESDSPSDAMIYGHSMIQNAMGSNFRFKKNRLNTQVEFNHFLNPNPIMPLLLSKPLQPIMAQTPRTATKFNQCIPALENKNETSNKMAETLDPKRQHSGQAGKNPTIIAVENQPEICNLLKQMIDINTKRLVVEEQRLDIEIKRLEIENGRYQQEQKHASFQY